MSLEESAAEEPASKNPKSSMSAQRLAAQLLDESDRAFFEALQSVGLLAELDGDELLRIATEVDELDRDRRRVDYLALYYAAGGAEATAEARRLSDRFFLQSVGQPATAAGLVTRLAALTPELEGVVLERIGGEDGPLVLRCGDHFAAVLDHFEEEADTDQIDLRDLEADDDVPMVTVRGLVHALNVLLERRGIRERLVSLRGDPHREVYVQLGMAEAARLLRDGYLEDDELEYVMELAAW